MRQTNITPENTEFVLLCFEGPDAYSMAGGLGVRIEHLSSTLAKMGFVTHLFFVGDPEHQGEEARFEGKLALHRWCQWVSRYYPNGVYQGENEKLYDFNESIPWFVKERIIKPAVAQGKLVVILGEEWQTAEAMCRLSDVLYNDGLRDKVVMFWNANNTFSFDRINWGRLSYVTTITTVSRYMKHLMWRIGLNPLVIPNGIPKSALRNVDNRMVNQVRKAAGADLLLCKVARWHPDKRWNMAIEATAGLKEKGLKTTLLARGGSEPHSREVVSRARSLGLKVSQASATSSTPNGYLTAIEKAAPADIIDISFHLPLDFLQVMYRAADGVLANSGHEPFGLVGLEAMAAGGIVFTGCTGEDYAIHLVNAIVLDTADPKEIVSYVTFLRDYPEEDARIRQAARRISRHFTWEAVVQSLIGKLENQARVQGVLRGAAKPMPLPLFEVEKESLEGNSNTPYEARRQPMADWLSPTCA
jgi:glycosyltransferase involved in cell wall biosynthesis